MTKQNVLKFRQKLQLERLMLIVSMKTKIASKAFIGTLELFTNQYKEKNPDWKNSSFGQFLDQLLNHELLWTVDPINEYEGFTKERDFDYEVAPIMETINYFRKQGEVFKVINILDKSIKTSSKEYVLYFDHKKILQNLSYEEGLILFQDLFQQFLKKFAA